MSRAKTEPDLDEEALTAFPDLDAPVNETRAAAFLGFKPATMRQWRWQGRGPAYLKNGDEVQSPVRYEPRVLIRYRNRLRRRSTSEASP